MFSDVVDRAYGCTVDDAVELGGGMCVSILGSELIVKPVSGCGLHSKQYHYPCPKGDQWDELQPSQKQALVASMLPDAPAVAYGPVLEFMHGKF